MRPAPVAGYYNRQLVHLLRRTSRGVHIDATLDHTPVWRNSRLVERLVANLTDNALRHNIPDGRIEITTTTRDSCAVLSVANSGPVIAPHEVARLMQPFQRLAPDRTASRDGHGLGLAIVHAIATTHGARFTALPRPGGGLDVEITFPATGKTADRPGTRPVLISGSRE